MDFAKQFFFDHWLEFVGVFIAFIALWRTSRFNERMLKLEEENAKLASLQRRKIEEEDARQKEIQIGCYVYYAANGSTRVMVRNIGRVTAYDVRFQFEPPAGRSSPEVSGELAEKFPIEEFKPAREVNFLIAPADDTGDMWPAVITWRDQNKKKFSDRIALQMGG